MLLGLEENAIRKESHAHAATVPVDDRELQRMFSNRLNCGFDCQGETLSQLWADIVVPCVRVQQILIRFWGPDNWEVHNFLKSPDLTCFQGMTSIEFCSCRAMR